MIAAVPAHAPPLMFGGLEPQRWDNEYMASIGNPVTILLIDDDEPIRCLVRDVLTDHRYQVIEARDGAEGLDFASAHEGPIHLLLTDIIMPKLNGLVLAERLAQLRPETAVLLMSGYVDG